MDRHDCLSHLGNRKRAREKTGPNAVLYWDANSNTQVINILWEGSGDPHPSLYNGTFAWTGDDKLYYYNGVSIETLVQGGSPHAASLSDATIAFAKCCPSEIWYWDGTSTREIAKAPFIWYRSPSIYNGTSAYSIPLVAGTHQDPDYSGIYYWDGNSTTEILVDIEPLFYSNNSPSLYDGAIAWTRNQAVYYWDGGSLEFEGQAGGVIPEPNTMLLLGSGLIGLVGFRRKLKKS